MRSVFLLILILFLSRYSHSQHFAPAVTYQFSNAPINLSSGDYNKDNKADLVVMEFISMSECRLNVLIAQSDGKMNLKYKKAFKSRSLHILTADVNNDSKPDIILNGEQQVDILLGDGTGNFVLKNSYFFEYPASTIDSDFNKDGFIDLAVTNMYADNISILLGNGKGDFSSSGEFKTGDQPAAVKTGDFNNDTYPDLVITNQQSNDIAILINNKTGSFPTTDYYGVGDFPTHVEIADLDNDNNLDLAVASVNNTNDIALFSGNGQGTFTLIQSFHAEAQALIIRDFTCDSKPDLIVAGSKIRLYENTADGFKLKDQINVGWDIATNIVAADFNRDGGFDIAVSLPNFLNIKILRNSDGCDLYLKEDPTKPTTLPFTSLPNIITPNRDQLNDYFVINWTDTVPENVLQIYDRWGNLIFSDHNYKNDWGGRNLMAGVYYYTLQLPNSSQVYKGWITIIR